MFGFTFISGVVTLVLYPQPLFANKLEYKNFKIYSNNKISTDFKVVLDNATFIVTSSELYDPSYTYDVFLCYDALYNRLDDMALGRGPSARAIDNNLVIKIRVNPKINIGFPTFHKRCEIDLTYLIAHEMIHCLQANKYGKMKFNPFRHPEMWKLEGYPEYVSKQIYKINTVDLANEIDRYEYMCSKAKDGWLAVGDGKCDVPEIYYKSGLMMKYLIDIKNISYDEILTDTISETIIYNEMRNWKDKHKQANN